MTEKQKYIGVFLDGYFHDKELDYNLLYFKISGVKRHPANRYYL